MLGKRAFFIDKGGWQGDVSLHWHCFGSLSSAARQKM